MSKEPIEKIREGLYIKKSFDGYRVVYPYKNDDGTINWFSILTGGNWWKLVKLLFLLAIILGVSFSYAHDTKNCREMISNPCKIFPSVESYNHYCSSYLYNTELEEKIFSLFNSSGGEKING